jgi:hypothetical protein
MVNLKEAVFSGIKIVKGWPIIKSIVPICLGSVCPEAVIPDRLVGCTCVEVNLVCV